MDQAGQAGTDDVPSRDDQGQGDQVSAPAVTTRERSSDQPDGDQPDGSQPGGDQPGGDKKPPARPAGWAPWQRIHPVTRHLVILAAYLFGGIVFTWPRFTYLTDHKLPDTRDAGSYVWGFWWIARQVEHFSNPWFTRYLAAPVGAELGFHALMPLPGLIMMPITVAFGPSASYNLLSVLMPGLLAYAMYRVATLWVRSQTAAIAAGALFGLSSMLAYQSFYLLNIAAGALFMPLALEAAVRLRRRPGWPRAVILGVVLGASLLTDQESAVLALIVAALALLPWTLLGPSGSNRTDLHQLLLRLRQVALAAVVTLVVASPQIIAMVQQAHDGGTSIDPHLLAVSYINYGVGLSALFGPSPRIATFGFTRLASEFYYHGLIYYHDNPHAPTNPSPSPMFGLILTILAVFGLIVCWRRRHAWALALLWLGASLLALGPVLWIGTSHQYAPLAEWWNGVRVSALMPYTWFVRIPGLSSFREAGRLAELGLVAAALLAGAGIEWLRHHVQPVLAVMLILAMFELGWSGNPPGPATMQHSLRIGVMSTSLPKLDGPIAADHSDSIVVDFPYGIRGGIPLYGQAFSPEAQVLATADGHPRAIAYISRVPAPTVNGIESHPFYVDLVSVWHQHDIPTSAAQLRAAARDARRMNVGWVVVWPTGVLHSITHFLTHTGFRFDYRVGRVRVYRAIR
jgi:hypothetical protein